MFSSTSRFPKSMRLALTMGMLLSLIPGASALSQTADPQETRIEPQATGDLDSSFGSAGKVTDPRLAALAMVVQGDGKILIGGSTATVGLARYNADGSLDTTFGDSGYVSGALPAVHAIAIQPDGKIVVVGPTQGSASPDFGVVRYDANGNLDASFGHSGQVSTDFFGFEDVATAVLIQSDGRIVVGGRARTGTVAGGFGLARYNQNGSLDASFGSGGKVLTSFPGADLSFVRRLAIQPDQRIVAAGSQLLGLTNMVAARYTADGNLDSSFGSGGRVAVDFSISDLLSAMVIQQDNRIVLAGAAVVGTTNFNFALARLNPEGTLDSTFGAGGKVMSDFCGDTDVIRSIALQGDGRILVAGSCNSTTGDFSIARYTANGVLDATFGSGGHLTTDFLNNFDVVIDAAIQANGRLLVAGQVMVNSTTVATGIAGYVLASDFGVGFSRSHMNGERGTTVKVSVSVIRTSGFSGTVTVIPPDASSLKIKVKPGSPKTTNGSSASFKLKIKGSAPVGSHQLTFTGRDDTGRERSATLTLLVE
jgi:uncharacterized delta-60 repeat protein